MIAGGRPLSATSHGRELYETLRRLTTEARNPRTREIDLASTTEILSMLHAEDRQVADVVEAVLPQLASIVDHIHAAFEAGGRLFYVGAGTSGRLGVLDAAECPPTYSTPSDLVTGLIAGGHETLVRSREGVEDDAHAGADVVDQNQLTENDVLIGISASRRTPYVRGALGRARTHGAWTAFLICNPLDEAPETVADCVVELVVGPEAVTGSTRMKSALAQKMVLTMLSTAAMIRWGKVYENLMVDVAPTSQKLRERAKGLVMLLADVDYARAERLLEESSHEVKTAVVMARQACSATDARRQLADHGSLLRKTLESES